MAYIWHKVSDQEKEEIKKDAKHLLDEFSSKISNLKFSESEKNEKENLREQGKGWETDSEFREIMMENAPMVQDGLIIAETGKWKK